MAQNKKAVCLLSGGMDSSTLAYLAKDMGYDICALHTTYGQRTEKKEGQCAEKIAELLGAVEFAVVPLDYFSSFGGSSLTDKGLTVHDHDNSGKSTGDAVDLSRDNDQGGESIPNTYVPFRNANLLSIATSYAEAKGADAIFIGVQASDYSGYPDCRPEFIDAFQKVIDLGTSDDTDIKLITPFVNLNKTEILKKGFELGVPYEYTWSCYRDDHPACGSCDSCYFRLKAFKEAGRSDPIEYRNNLCD
ncbi:7-cyano-7-deazaguanine synthase QueC [Methanoplanus endosymbiosus]|uniref:7-cyano-7-deazaguanine synthase n=1 Tax=Methanoplanus endosymbiosus TaxID=33865 RepID=A0A9E7PNI9_9EURY|nr:7-cyano-7-deazaguanine synthase QueC [Methanoplanus endosymbiosus]UUX93575.1 7-cyano-7-deazaguanine synthase QueC [Methanoplanus endosymbiosus]